MSRDLEITSSAAGRLAADGWSYWSLSRTHTYSLTFALPLLVLYEMLVLPLSRGAPQQLRNGADWVVRWLLDTAGIRGTAGVTLALIAGALFLILRERQTIRVPLRPKVFVGMFVESTVLAVLFAYLVSRLTRVVLSPLPFVLGLQVVRLSVPEELVLSLGAGVYEELVFRVLLVTAIAGLVMLLTRLTRVSVPRVAALGVAVVVSAFLFSLVHYLGPFADPPAITSFTFRCLAGLVFSVIFALRGYGIVAWTHALYDVYVILGIH